MAYAKVNFKNPHNGKVKEAPAGFSWTTLLFSFLPALFRGDYKWSLIMFILLFLTAGLSGFVFPFIYNKLYIKELVSDGFEATSATPVTIESVAQRYGMMIPSASVN